MTEIPLYEYFYDAQTKRYIQQIVRAFSGWQYATGRKNPDGTPELRTVPCRPATTNRMVASLMRGGDNALLTVPLITVHRSEYAINKSQDGSQTFSSTIQIAQRDQDPTTGKYTKNRGQGYTIERLQPYPIEMTIQVDIWTSNMDQKDQLLEQMLPVVGREFDIQNSDNAVDWTALTTMKCTNIQLSSRAIPIGTEDEIDVATLTFTLPCWINPPAKITRQVLIQQVITNVDGTAEPVGEGAIAQTIVAPNDYRIGVQKGEITLLGRDSTPKPWSELESIYRTRIFSGVTQLRLRKTTTSGSEIVGTLHKTTDPNIMGWQIDVDTLPSNTLAPVNGIIRPLNMSPGQGLPIAQNGQRYIIYDDLGSSQAWGSVHAKAHDIIEYRDGVWSVAHAASSLTSAYVSNLRSGTQLRWSGNDWEKSIDGVYIPGDWRIFS